VSSIEEEAQKAAPDPLVTLFILDATSLGAEVYRFTSSRPASGVIVFDGEQYTPVPVEADGFEWNGQGPMPKPRLRISNVGGLVLALVVTFGDLLGATVTRLRTFRRFLDDGSDPDPNALLPVDVFSIERKSHHSREMVEWELAPKLDQEGKFIPARVALRDTCRWVYRIWNPATESFDYTRATCPYSGDLYFQRNGQPTTDPALDGCGKLLVHCRARFGVQPLPFGGFPSLAKVRAQ
jgi:lambda family phage minor tail protein L